MKKTNTYFKYSNDLWRFVSKVIKAIVSSIPSEKVYLEPNKKAKVYMGDEEIKPDYEKHYQRPRSKPVVEKQTLLKEIKKTDVSHK